MKSEVTAYARPATNSLRLLYRRNQNSLQGEGKMRQSASKTPSQRDRNIGQVILNRADERARQPKNEHTNNSKAPNAAIQLDIMRTYIGDISFDATQQDLSGFINACHLAFDGRGTAGIKEKAVNTILGQEAQMLRVRGVLEYLASEGLIAYAFDPETADHMVKDEGIDVNDLAVKFKDVTEAMILTSPYSKGCFNAYFPYSWYWLIYTIVCDRFLRPGVFDLDGISDVVQQRLNDTAL